MSKIVMALPTGRLSKNCFSLLEAAGVELDSELKKSRKLMFEVDDELEIIMVKPVDVPTYVERGIADIGVAGRDTLLETPNELYQPLDLGFGRCRICVAGPPEFAWSDTLLRPLRVATKYPRITYRHFNRLGTPIEVIKCGGAVELACLSGLSDLIVDLVETGRTLRANGLVVIDEITTSTARLVVNRASHKLKLAQVRSWYERLRAALEVPGAS